MTTAQHRPGRLTDTQLGLLSTAAQRDDRLVVRGEAMPEKAAAAALKLLFKHGLVTEVRVKRGQPHWRRKDANQRMAQLEQSRTALVRVGSVFAALFGLALDVDRKM
jgi:hypothetical protein